MVSITEDQVANALHLDNGAADLPTGASLDIEAAEELVGEDVEPYTDKSALVKKTAIYVACAFLTGTEDDFAISSISRESATISYDTANTSKEASDFWTRAKTIDPTDRLGRETVSFTSIGSGGS